MVNEVGQMFVEQFISCLETVPTDAHIWHRYIRWGKMIPVAKQKHIPIFSRTQQKKNPFIFTDKNQTPLLNLWST